MENIMTCIGAFVMVASLFMIVYVYNNLKTKP